MKLSRNEKQSILKPRAQSVEVGEGADAIQFNAQAMTLEQRIKYESLLEHDTTDGIRYMVACSVIDDDGTPVFDNMEEFAGISAPVFALIAEACMEVNRSKKKSVTSSTPQDNG